MTRRIRALWCALLLHSLPLAAQEAPRDTLRPVLLAPVEVTVLRTPIALARAPYAVSVKTRDEIQRAKPGLGLDEALRGIPGVQVDNRYNYALGERISIRGFGARAQFGVRGVRVLVDGVPATFPDGQTALSHVELGTLGRAEVIRGPASALYGGSAGGVIQLETEAPPLSGSAQELGIVGGADGLLRLHGSSRGRGGSTGYVVHLSRLDYEGYRDHAAAQSVRFNARLDHAGERSALRVTAAAVDYDALNPGSLSAALLAEDRAQAFQRNRVQRTGEEGRQGQIGAVWTRRAGDGEIEVSSYAITRAVDNPIPTTIVVLDRTAAGARALYRGDLDGALRWTVGGAADAQFDDRQNYANRQGSRGALALDQRERVHDLALFAQATAEPHPRLTLLGGVRYDWYRFAARDRLIEAGNPDDSGERDLSALSPSAGVTYALADALRLYANAATSFETPTTTELANRPSGAGGFNPELEPQTARSLEAGARGELAGRIRYGLALYRAAVENSLIGFEVPGAAGRQFFRNAGAALHRGAEAELELAPAPGLRLSAAYSYTDARFREYTSGAADFAGKRVPGVAPHRAEARAAVQGRAGWFAELEGRYASEVAVNDANTAVSPSHLVTDLRAGMTGVRIGGVAAEPFVGVSNLLDEEYNTSVVVNAFGGRFYEPGPGRSLYAGLRVRF